MSESKKTRECERDDLESTAGLLSHLQVAPLRGRPDLSVNESHPTMCFSEADRLVPVRATCTRTRQWDFEAAPDIRFPWCLHRLPPPFILRPNLAKENPSPLRPHRPSPSLPTGDHATKTVPRSLAVLTDRKNAVAVSDVSDAGAAGHGGSSPSPGPMPEKNVVAASDVDAAAATAGVSGHGCSSSLRSPATVDASPLPLLSDLGDPFEDLPAFD